LLQQRLEALDQKTSQLEKEKKQIDATKDDLNSREQQMNERELRHKEECLVFVRDKERETLRRTEEQSGIDRSRDELHSQEQALQLQLGAVAQEKDELSLLKSKVDESRCHYVQLASEFWPAAFVDGPLSQWRSRIEDRLNQPESVAKLLWLAIGKFEAHLQKKESRELPRALVDLGKNAYRFWVELGLDATAQSRAAQEWASVLESETGGNYRLRIAEPGLPKDPAWMAFGMIAGNSSVHEVQGWCVLDSRNFPVEKANVA
jgi:chromosome segregation ATPase